MYYQNYEDYMRSVLGYPTPSRQNTYEMTYEMQYMPDVTYANPSNDDKEMMDLYPEIYRIVNPMVCKICENNTKPLSRELLESMTDEIYSNLESDPKMDTVVNVRVNTQAPSSERSNRTSLNSSSSSNSNLASTNSNIKSKREDESKQSKENSESRETRQIGVNRGLRDLIKILILNQLLGGGIGHR